MNLSRRRLKALPTHEKVLAVLDYDSITGIFLWKSRPDCPRHWNTRWAGTQAGYISDRGRRLIMIDGVRYFANRLAWLYVHGVDPGSLVDHENCQTGDDWIDNLRLATDGENTRNSRGWSGRSLPKGVSKSGRRFQARILANGKQVNLGSFGDPADAAIAYAKAAKQHYGEFARSA